MRRKVGATLAAVLLFLACVPGIQAVSSTTMYIMLYIDRQEAFINDEMVTLDSPATIVDGRTFVPAKFLGDAMGLKVEWDEQAAVVRMETTSYQITLSPSKKEVFINDVLVPFDDVAKIINGRLLVRLTWLADYMGAKYQYNAELQRVEIVYVKKPDGLSIGDDSINSKPVAKFALNKRVYRTGEPVKYIDLSYDPDAEGLPKYEWEGNKEVFFTPGRHRVSLRVTDSSGNVSNEYLRWVEVIDEPYLSELEYALHYKPVNSYIKADWSMLWAHFWDLPQLPKKAVQVPGRKLLVSDSPETFYEKGILYQDTINGKGRLYADHINGTKERVQFTILATNNTDKEITVHTTNRGEVYPSIYANIIGHEASVDFLLADPLDIKLTIPPRSSRVFVQLPYFLPDQGVNLFYDVETDGEIMFSFLAMDLIDTPVGTFGYHPLPFDGHVRGSFPVSEVQWTVDASSYTKPSRLILGDGVTDPWVEGYDVFRQEDVKNQGNYGVVYKIHAEKPRKGVILILARGGNFKGPFKFNGEFVMVPPSGLLTAFDGLQILARTTGKEEALDIEFTPPAGSAFPVDLIFYPLDDKE
jgi:hypothetical protein